MNRRARHLARHASILGASTLALTAATARADITVQYDSWLLPFSYEATSVPDFDQRRTGLGNNGSMYCVPTSAMDWLAYITNHGAPEVMGGVENWQSQAVYGQVTGQLAGLGFFMGTEPGSNGGGTGLDGGRHGIATWLDNTTSKPFIVTSQGRDIEWAPKLAYLVANAKNQGLVMPMVGWYEQSGSVIDREGGHCIAMTRATQSAQLQKSIGFHDPASDENPNDLGMQSPFSQTVNTVVDTQVIEFFIPHYRSKVVGMTSGGKQGYVDGMITIRPLWILAPDPTVNAVIGLFSFTLDGNEPPAITRTFMPEGSVLRDIAIHSDAMQIASIIDPADGPPEVRLSTPGTDEVMRITGMEDPRRLVIGARRGLYLLDANDLVLFHMDGDDGPQEIKRIPLPAYAQTIAYDDKKHEVVALSAEEHVLMAMPHDLGQEPEMRFIPDEVMLQMESEIAWDPSTEGWWIATPGSDVLSHMRWTDDAGLIVTMQVELPGFSAPSSFDVGDDGRLYVMAENGLNELAPTETGDYELAVEPHFPDFELPGPIRVAKSRTNYDPDLHDGPAWRNELPDPDAPECIGDADGNGDVGFSDLSALLAAWGACPAAPAPCPMDLDQDGDVDFGDLTALLGAWGACP